MKIDNVIKREEKIEIVHSLKIMAAQNAQPLKEDII